MGDSVGTLAEMTEALSEGKFTQEFSPHFSGELGQLAQFLDTLQQNLQVLSPTIGSSAHLVPQVARAVADISQQTETSANSMLGLMEEMRADQDQLSTLIQEAKNNGVGNGSFAAIEKIVAKSKSDLIHLTSHLSFQDVVRQRSAKVQKLIDNVEQKISELRSKFGLDVHGISSHEEGSLAAGQEEATEFAGDAGVDQNLIDDLFENRK
jgi:methyl-accepting chemotaxis protein